MFASQKSSYRLTVGDMNKYITSCYTGALLLINSANRVVNCSSTLLNELGYLEADLIGRDLRLLGLEETCDSLETRYRDTMESREPPPVAILKKSTGELVSSRFVTMTFLTEEGSELLLYLFDIRPIEKLTLLQKFAGTFLDDITLGVMLIDMDFRLIDISDMACRVLGLNKAAVVGRPMEEIFRHVPTQHQLVQRSILSGMVVRNHAVSWMNNQARYELLLDTNLLKDDHGETVGAYVIFKDVSNLRSLEEQVQRSDRLAMIGQIAAGTAHEIRNPLTSIKGFMQVLKNTFAEKGMSKEQDYTDIMLTEINRINELCSEFLLLSKPKHVSFESVSVPSVLREILPIIHNEALLHGINVVYEALPDMPEVVADGELLKQVFLNICKNGIEAMSEGGLLRITEQVMMDDRKICIEIHDTGPGIPNFVIDKIFDPFYTTKEDGTGLGLSVCQRIIHDIGGTIRVSSKGFGTIFSVNIPFP